MATWLNTKIKFPTADEADAALAARLKSANPYLKYTTMGKNLRMSPRFVDRAKARPWARASAWEHCKLWKKERALGKSGKKGQLKVFMDKRVECRGRGRSKMREEMRWKGRSLVEERKWERKNGRLVRL